MRRVSAWILGWLAACALLFAGLARAQDVLPVPLLSNRVIDQTATLTPAQADALVAKLAALEASRGAQVVLLMVPSTQPEDIASYAQRVADAWKIGRRQVGDGLLIVVAKDDRKVRIEVAKTLEGAVPDVLAGRIIREQISPAFKAGDYAGGLNLAVDKLSALIAGEALPPPPQAQAQRHAPSAGFDWQDMAIFLFVGVPIAGAVLSAVFGRKLGALITGGAVGGLGWFLTTSLLVAAGAGLVALFLVGVMGVGGSSRRGGGVGGALAGGLGGMLGGGGFSGGGGGGGGGGGFSSGGGGDFGGGGASGDW